MQLLSSKMQIKTMIPIFDYLLLVASEKEGKGIVLVNEDLFLFVILTGF